MVHEHVNGMSIGPLPVLFVAALIVIPFWRLFTKAGYSGWLSFSMLIPLVNVLALYVLAFSDWPALRNQPSSRSKSPSPLDAGTSPILDARSKPATNITKAANDAALQSLPFDEHEDFENARRGLIAQPRTLTVSDANGKVVWDLEQFKTYIRFGLPAPDTVNPSLWRHAQLNMFHGLFRVTDRIYQVRGYDLSNITFVEGDSGWIVFDPLISTETAKAAFALVTEHLGVRPIVAVVYSHSHIDHFGGVAGLVDEADVKAGKVRILAPENFLEHAIRENVIAGNAMARRSTFMYGSFLPRNPQGAVNAGLGQAVSTGTMTLIAPTETITKTGEAIVIDGVRMIFQLTPDTEAPVEMNTYFPQLKAMWIADNTTNTLHNLYTLRGAPVRDAVKWSKFINETIDLYGKEIEVKFQGHHWPLWGNAEIIDYLKKQRDLYKYIHDQSVRLMNEGLTAAEIAEVLDVPAELARVWANRGYYGTLKHNARAVYQFYMGWYDGNPANLDPLPPEAAAKKYVAYMGGAQTILEKARKDFDHGDYRWVSEVLKHLVFAEPHNRDAKYLLADAFEQLGYQAESGSWRSAYLQGAHELRNGNSQGEGADQAHARLVKAMSPEQLFDVLAVQLNAQRATGKKLALLVNFTDLKQQYALTVENGVLNYERTSGEQGDAKLTLAKTTLDRIQLGQTSDTRAFLSGEMHVEGRRAAFREFFDLFDRDPLRFNIVTP
jgi:alkyl sulfatase BDS1-like metallo-beta-lactamase superfamily hydrolase